jgi:hypothetical protein
MYAAGVNISVAILEMKEELGWTKVSLSHSLFRVETNHPYRSMKAMCWEPSSLATLPVSY